MSARAMCMSERATEPKEVNTWWKGRRLVEQDCFTEVWGGSAGVISTTVPKRLPVAALLTNRGVQGFRHHGGTGNSGWLAIV